MASKFYGFITLSGCYHATDGCPVLRHVAKNPKVQIREYESEPRAIAQGHRRRCRLCLGDKVFDINKNDLVYISNEQHAVLKTVADIFNKNGPMTLRQISERRKRSVVSTYLIVKKLRSEGLLEHKLKMGGQRASGGSIAPTKRGMAVLSSKALPESPTK